MQTLHLLPCSRTHASYLRFSSRYFPSSSAIALWQCVRENSDTARLSGDGRRRRSKLLTSQITSWVKTSFAFFCVRVFSACCCFAFFSALTLESAMHRGTQRGGVRHVHRARERTKLSVRLSQYSAMCGVVGKTCGNRVAGRLRHVYGYILSWSDLFSFCTLA